MEVYVFRGLPGSDTLRVARKLLPSVADRVIDLTSYWETDQGNLFISQSPPEQAKKDIQFILRSGEAGRLGICGSMNKSWIRDVIQQSELEEVEVHWLVVEGAVKPSDSSKRFYRRLEETFELDLIANA